MTFLIRDQPHNMNYILKLLNLQHWFWCLKYRSKMTQVHILSTYVLS